MDPIRWEHHIPVYSSTQIETYGDHMIPWQEYMVVEGEPVYIESYQYRKQATFIGIHRYDRQARFKKTLYNLLGWSNFNQTLALSLRTEVLGPLKTFIKDDTVNSYEDCRKILIHFGYKNLIPSIPALLKMAGKPAALIIDQKNMSELIQLVLQDFKAMERKFFDGDKENRTYCPNMKYLALRLLVDRGATNVCIPLLRTKRKLEDIDKVYNKLRK